MNDKNLKRRAEHLNQRVFNHLIRLLKDESRRIKRNACTALADPDSKMIEPNQRIVMRIEELKKVAEEDLDGFVRRTAEFSLNVVRGWIKEWTEKEPALDIKLRGEYSDKLIFEKKRREKKESKNKADKDKEILKVARRDTIEY
ncbi:MAG: HEAT repeat domain-containing protein [Nitrososphaeraceae archaeon]|nr:HEAT repeat domain-containing protein [Nitrososphaeraceae archaeon]